MLCATVGIHTPTREISGLGVALKCDMRREITGCGTALVTPFRPDGLPDHAALRRLVQIQLNAGVDFLVPCGATGEESTLTDYECDQILSTVIDEVSGRLPIVASVCGNDTRRVADRVVNIGRLGIDAVLCVVPYYNVPTQEGLWEHFSTIASGSPVPIILYNVPGRTATTMEPATVASLSKISNVIGIKEASLDLMHQSELLLQVPQSFKVFVGYDCFIFPVMCLGAVGTISVTSNLVPEEMARLVHLILEKRYGEALEVNRKWWWLMKSNYVQVNPIPVKAALSMMGLVEERYRLPLRPMQAEQKAKLRDVLSYYGLIRYSAEQAPSV